jgi:hypothetical protein
VRIVMGKIPSASWRGHGLQGLATPMVPGSVVGEAAVEHPEWRGVESSWVFTSLDGQ